MEKRTIQVDHKTGDLFEISVRDHRLHVDQPIEDGGTDVGPTPVELFVTSLATCVAVYARRYLARHDLPDGLSVRGEFTMAEHPTRIGEVSLVIRLPEGVPDQRRAALLAVVSHCTVHNTLENPPEVDIVLDEPGPPASGS
jgi:putative redox protein